MTERYRMTTLRRLGNRVVRLFVRLGLGDKQTYLLKVRGRKSGRVYSTPVILVGDGDDRWLVAPYGEREWVKNARAAGWVELSRKGRTERAELSQADPKESAPVLREYVRQVPTVRKYFDAKPDSPVEEFEAKAPRHPVFRIRPG